MASVARRVAIVCWIMVCLLLAACGVTTDPAGATSGRPHGYIVTRCDGSQIQHAAPSSLAPAAPSSVYFGTGGVFAFAAQDGSLRWCARFTINGTYTCPVRSCPAPPIAAVGMPLEADGVVYVCVAGAGGFTYAFNAADGVLRWSRETGCGIYAIPTPESGQPLLSDGVLFSGEYGLNPADGSIRWHLPLQAIMGAVQSGVVYATTEHTVYAIGVADSTVHWKYDVDAPIGGRPAVFGDHVYVGDINGDSPPAVTRGLTDTYALDALSGALRWRSPTGIVTNCSAVETLDLVYICGDNALDALDVQTGAIRWRVKVPYDGYVESTPVVSADTVYFSGDGVYAVDARTGAVRWHNTLGWNMATAVAPPVLAGNLLIVTVADGGGHGTLVGLDAATGTMRWQHGGFNQIGPAASG